MYFCIAMNNNKNTYSVIILAAGLSKRMGTPKFNLSFDKKNNFLTHIIYKYNDFNCNKIIVILNNEGTEILQQYPINYPEKTTIIENKFPEKGRFHSIKLGIEKAIDNCPVFIHNIDNPFVNHTVLKKMLTYYNPDYTVPVFSGKGGHPVLLSRHICMDILHQERDDIILSDFLKKYNKIKVEVEDDKILVNINTKDDYNKYF